MNVVLHAEAIAAIPPRCFAPGPAGVFQNYREALFSWMSTIDNIAHPLLLEGRSQTLEVFQREVRR